MSARTRNVFPRSSAYATVFCATVPLLLLLAACSGSDSGDATTPTEDTDDSTVVTDTSDTGVDTGPTDTGYATEVTYDYEPCVDPITDPFQVGWELSEHSPGLELLAVVEANLDPTCLVSCTEGTLCTEASCTTADGADLTYRQVSTTTEHPYTIVTTTVMDATILFPPGHALTEITVHHDKERTRYTEADGGWNHTQSVTGSWEGALHPTLPDVGTLVESETAYSDDCCWGTDRTFDVNGCETHFVEQAPTGWSLDSVERGGQLVVDWYDDIWLDGVCVGHAYDDTYLLEGPCQDETYPPKGP